MYSFQIYKYKNYPPVLLFRTGQSTKGLNIVANVVVGDLAEEVITITIIITMEIMVTTTTIITTTTITTTTMTTEEDSTATRDIVEVTQLMGELFPEQPRFHH